ncbi:MAG: bifunctional phosphopantothenoylcysteine decarboxylase/phosphopantothenate--cysteine ligase CoaBC [Parvibaculaceae bacterium]
MLHGKRIILILGGGIAAYKCLELIRRVKERGCGVRVIMTRAAKEFVTPLSVASLTREKVYDDLFSLTDEAEMGHIELSRSADLLVVAPATADLMARMAAGLANDLATTTLLATDKPVMIVPAMNVRMWQHPATQRNLKALQADGVTVVGPNDGDMACGEYGPGRMAEPAEIIAAIEAHFGGKGAAAPAAALSRDRPLQGRKVLVTAGPTHEPIDPVRYIANRSSGRQGYALGAAAVALGAETIIVSGPVNLPLPPGAGVVPVETGQEMLKATERELPADIAVFTAAVADWRVAAAADQKLKKDGSGKPPALALEQNPDILKTVATRKEKRPRLVVGFAAETENVIENAKRKLAAKGCDLIVANDVSKASGVMGGSRNTVHLVSAGGVESWPEMGKDEVANRLMRRLAEMLGKAS